MNFSFCIVSNRSRNKSEVGREAEEEAVSTPLIKEPPFYSRWLDSLIFPVGKNRKKIFEGCIWHNVGHLARYSDLGQGVVPSSNFANESLLPNEKGEPCDTFLTGNRN